MKKELKDFIHLYIGCGIFCPNPHDDESEHLVKGFLTGIHGEYGAEIAIIDGHHTEEEPHYEEFKKVKLILRNLDSMTEEEANQLFDIHYSESGVFKWRNCFQVNRHSAEYWINYESSKRDRINVIKFDELKSKDFTWLLSKSFDLFNLIPEGLAIDSATLKP